MSLFLLLLVAKPMTWSHLGSFSSFFLAGALAASKKTDCSLQRKKASGQMLHIAANSLSATRLAQDLHVSTFIPIEAFGAPNSWSAAVLAFSEPMCNVSLPSHLLCLQFTDTSRGQGWCFQIGCLMGHQQSIEKTLRLQHPSKSDQFDRCNQCCLAGLHAVQWDPDFSHGWMGTG